MGLSDLSPLIANVCQYTHQTLLPFSPNPVFLLAFGKNSTPGGTALGPNTVPHRVAFFTNASRNPAFGKRGTIFDWNIGQNWP